MRESEVAASGNLPPLARMALEPRMDRVQQAVRLRELALDSARLAEPAAGGKAAAQELRQTATAAAERGRLPGAPAQERGASRTEGPDGTALRQVQAELRSLRTEISRLSRIVGTPLRESNRLDYKGILQERDELDSDVQLMRWREEDSQLQGRINADLRRQEAARIAERQQELLRVLRRAEQELAQAPDKLPPGLRESVIGEIYHARYSSAMFGGASGVVNTSTLLNQVA